MIKKIVIVDDEPDVLKVLDKRLYNAGYLTYTADNGVRALDLIKGVRPDLIILDMMMPGIDGIEVKKKLNDDKLAASIPVIFLTARDMMADKVAGLKLGAADYITKPFEIDELLARVNFVLKLRAKRE